jgi:hypothetical protein
MMNNDEYVLSVDDNDLIIYKKIDASENNVIKYVCKNCINLDTKRTKRLCYAIKNKDNMSFKIISFGNSIELTIQHPLYDDDVYILKDSEISETIEIDQIEEKETPLCYIYVLELEQNKLYVGKTQKPLSRIGDHLIASIHEDITGCSGAAWTTMYKPKRIFRVIASYDEFDEDLYTLRYMKEKGIDNVRGGSFCELNLTNDNVSTISKMISGSGDKCYFCGESDHYINNCPQRKVRRNNVRRKRQTFTDRKNIPKSRILKYYGATELIKNSSVEIEDKPNNLNKDDCNNIEYFCSYCGKQLDSKQNLLYHEKVSCKQSDFVQKSKKIDSEIDAIFEANKKYIK